MSDSIRKPLANRQKALQSNDNLKRKQLQSALQHEIRYAKRSFAHDVDVKFQSDTKSAWSGLKTLLKLNKKRAECSVDVDVLNTFYARFETDDISIPDLPVFDHNLNMFSVDMVYNTLCHLDVSKSSGPDRLSARLLKTLADCLAQPLCTLFNNSLNSVTVPKIWKTADIIPLAKSKQATEARDFRPIALTPVIAKCLEKLIAPHIASSITDSTQFAYKRSRSTDDALSLMLDNITKHIDKSAKNYVRALFIDFSSAFNTIDTTRLVEKMAAKNINNNIINWTHSFLTSRQQRVRADDRTSSSITTSTGCPQGCVLSPILYSLYVEDMTVPDPFTIIKYADDTVILEYLSPHQSSELQTLLDNVTTWCDDNSLIVNSTKTKEVIFQNKRDDKTTTPVTIDDQQIEQVDEYKYLGTTVHKKLSFETNTNMLTDKAQKRLFIMKQLAYLNVKPSTIQLAYTTFIQSVLIYNLAIIQGHLTQALRDEYTHIINTAKTLSRGKINPSTMSELCDSQSRNKCLRAYCGANNNPTLVLDTLPSGRHRAVAFRTRNRIFSFRSICVQILNKLFSKQ